MADYSTADLMREMGTSGAMGGKKRKRDLLDGNDPRLGEIQTSPRPALMDDAMRDPANLEFRKGPSGLTAAEKPRGVQGLLDEVSVKSDQALTAIQTAKETAKAAGARQSPVGAVLGDLMASIVPSMVGSAARVAKAPMDYATGRDVDLRASDAALALPFTPGMGRAAAPAMRMSPEAGAVAGSGAGGFAFGAGLAGEANAAGDRITMPTQRSRAEFEAGYNVPRPAARTIDQAASAARAQYEQSPAYQAMVQQGKVSLATKRAQEVENAARANFATEQQAFDKSSRDWEGQREQAWKAEQGDYESRLKAFQNQGFWDRNPEVRPYAMGAAYALPAMFGAGTAIQRGRTQQRLTDAIMGDDVQKAAAAQLAANKYLNPSMGAQAGKAVTTTLAAGAPFELRSIGDAADAVFAPEGSGAQIRAKEHFANPAKYIAEGLPQAVTGAMLYGMGNKAGSLATRDAKSMLAGAAGTDAAAIQQAAARRGAAIEAQGMTDKAALDAAQSNAMQGIRNRGLLDAEAGNAALASKAAAEARNRSGAPVADLMAPQQAPMPMVQAAPQPLPVPSPQPQLAPAASPALPAPKPMKEPREWSRMWSDPARKSVEEFIAKNPGAPLATLEAPQLLKMIEAKLPAGAPKPSVTTVRGYLKELRSAVPDKPTMSGLQRQWRSDPSGLLFSAGGPAIAGGIALPGLLGDGPGAN